MLTDTHAGSELLARLLSDELSTFEGLRSLPESPTGFDQMLEVALRISELLCQHGMDTVKLIAALRDQKGFSSKNVRNSIANVRDFIQQRSRRIRSFSRHRASKAIQDLNECLEENVIMVIRLGTKLDLHRLTRMSCYRVLSVLITSIRADAAVQPARRLIIFGSASRNRSDKRGKGVLHNVMQCLLFESLYCKTLPRNDIGWSTVGDFWELRHNGTALVEEHGNGAVMLLTK